MHGKIDKVMGERQDIAKFRQVMTEDAQKAVNDRLAAKVEFMSINDGLMSQKVEKSLKYNDEKYAERMNYFPFTHGDAIDA